MEPLEIITEKAHAKLNTNLTLLSVSFIIFTFIATIRPDVLKDNVYLALQLAMSIPFLSSSIFARAKIVAHTVHVAKWDSYGYMTFIIAYAFLVNSIGILISLFIDFRAALIFWCINLASAFVYSAFEIHDGEPLDERLLRDGVFLAVILLGGIVPIYLS